MAVTNTIELKIAMQDTKPVRPMNVLFINPPTPSFGESFAKLLTFNTIPLALLYPATVLKQAGHIVRINDIKSGEKLSIGSKVDIVGITSDTVRYPEALQIAKFAKKLGKIVVMGGNHVSFDDEATLKTGYVDYIVRGEGEVTMLNLVNALSWGEGFNAKDIKGISWKDRHGEIHRNPPSLWIKDLDSLPMPDHSLLNIELYRAPSFNRFGKLGKPMFQISGSRGCPYDCSFCIVTSVYGAKWRARSTESMLHEVKLGLKLGFTNFFFVDDLFSTNYKRTLGFCEEILRTGMKFTWSAQCSTNSIADHPEMVEAMAKAGCEAVLLGVESMSAENLKLYRKRATVDDNFTAVKTLKKYGIVSLASTIVGTPTETHDTMNENFRYLMELDPEMLWINILTPYIGTDDWTTYQDRIFDRNWHHYDVYHSVMRLDYLKPSEVEFAQKRMMTLYHTRPKYLFRTLPNLFDVKGWRFGT